MVASGAADGHLRDRRSRIKPSDRYKCQKHDSVPASILLAARAQASRWCLLVRTLDGALLRQRLAMLIVEVCLSESEAAPRALQTSSFKTCSSKARISRKGQSQTLLPLHVGEYQLCCQWLVGMRPGVSPSVKPRTVQEVPLNECLRKESGSSAAAGPRPYHSLNIIVVGMLSTHCDSARPNLGARLTNCIFISPTRTF